MSSKKRQRGANPDDAALPEDVLAVLASPHHERQAQYEAAQEAYHQANLAEVRAERRARLAEVEYHCAFKEVEATYAEIDKFLLTAKVPRELERRNETARRRFFAAQVEHEAAGRAKHRAYRVCRRASDAWMTFIGARRRELEAEDATDTVAKSDTAAPEVEKP